MRRQFDGAGMLQTWGPGNRGTDDVLGCMHCFSTITRKSIEAPKNQLTTRARCWHCDGYLCAECGLEVQLYGHRHPDHYRTWPHALWIQQGMDEVYRRDQNAKILGV